MTDAVTFDDDAPVELGLVNEIKELEGPAMLCRHFDFNSVVSTIPPLDRSRIFGHELVSRW